MKPAHLITNLGTPRSPRYGDMFCYLAQFLSDKYVVDLPRLLWLPLLYGIILPFRSGKSGHAYAQIWHPQKGSPLRYHTAQLAQALQKRTKTKTLYAMRYGKPRLAATLDALKAQGHNPIRVTPIYPQYAAATTGTTLAILSNWQQKNPQTKLIVTPPWYAHPAYIKALAQSIQTHLKKHPQTQAVLVSFHGIPQRVADAGDPYQTHCQKTFALLQKALPKTKLILAYQSRFGREQWLQPYTDKVLEKLPTQSIKNLAVIAPGFACDCVETLEELGLRGKKTFLQSGGQKYTLIPCLNATDEHAKALADITKK